MNLTPAVIGVVVADMRASLAFYRRLGLEIPAEADGEPHVEVDLGGVRLAFDTRETVRSFDPRGPRRPEGHGCRWRSRPARPPRSTRRTPP